MSDFVYTVFGVFTKEYVPFETPPLSMAIDFTSNLKTEGYVNKFGDPDKIMILPLAGFYNYDTAFSLLQIAKEFYECDVINVGELDCTTLTCDRCGKSAKGDISFIRYHFRYKKCRPVEIQDRKLQKVYEKPEKVLDTTCPWCQKVGDNRNGRFGYYHLKMKKCLQSHTRRKD
jgi:hypothetical protein